MNAEKEANPLAAGLGKDFATRAKIAQVEPTPE
jgi:hypothetical protein